MKDVNGTQVCWKCRWLVTRYGFLKRKSKAGPCDRCLNEMSTFQELLEDEVWLRYIPSKDEKAKEDLRK